MRRSALLLLFQATALLAAPTVIRVNPAQTRQAIDGIGCGAIFYEGHITSLAQRGKTAEQERLYDDMFRDVRTDFLHLMIRPDHEPQNDNSDPYKPEFKEEWFSYAKHTLAICEAARKRRPSMRFIATLYTPPKWLKTNGEETAGGKARATFKPGGELELAEYCWAFLAHMGKHGQPVEFLCLANEPDWEHDQPGYWMTPAQNAELFAKAGPYFERMAREHPEVPRPKLVGPNVLSAVGCAENWLPPLFQKAERWVDVVGCHDYDRRGNRWETLTKAARGRHVWLTEWCVNGKDETPGLARSAAEYWLAMTEAFNGGAHAWMAYDWAYPPRQGGEALIHVNWGNSYAKTKIYHGFRQWCAPLAPGMKVAATDLAGPCATGISKPGVKASAFVSADGKRLVVHVAAVQDSEAEIVLKLDGPFARLPAQRYRTSPAEDMVKLPDAAPAGGQFPDRLPARGLATYLFGYPPMP